MGSPRDEDVTRPPSLRHRLNRIPHVDDAPPIEAEWTLPQGPSPSLIEPPPTADQQSSRRRVAAPVAKPTKPVWGTVDPHPPVMDEPSPVEPADGHPHRRRRWPRYLAVLALGLLAGCVAVGALAWRSFDSVERVPVAEVLDVPGSGTPGRNVLLVGTDSRTGITDDDANSELILGDGTSGTRTDTIMLLRLNDDGTAKFLSLPRDLWLPIDGGSQQRINTAIGSGPDALIRTVQDGLGLPVHHYVQVDLAGFIDLVDAVGGVTITIAHPAFDRASGLDLPVAGEVTLDSASALAWVRSRRYTEIIDGREVTDPTSDLGRVQRQQDFMRALFAEVSAERNPARLNSMVSAITDAIVLDDATSLGDAVTMAQRIRGAGPVSVVLPTIPADIGGAAVLLLGDGADEVLVDFR